MKKTILDTAQALTDSLANNPKVTATVAGTGAVMAQANTLQTVGTWMAILAGAFSILVSLKKLIKE